MGPKKEGKIRGGSMLGRKNRSLARGGTISTRRPIRTVL